MVRFKSMYFVLLSPTKNSWLPHCIITERLSYVSLIFYQRPLLLPIFKGFIFVTFPEIVSSWLNPKHDNIAMATLQISHFNHSAECKQDIQERKIIISWLLTEFTVNKVELKESSSNTSQLSYGATLDLTEMDLEKTQVLSSTHTS